MMTRYNASEMLTPDDPRLGDAALNNYGRGQYLAKEDAYALIITPRVNKDDHMCVKLR